MQKSVTHSVTPVWHFFYSQPNTEEKRERVREEGEIYAHGYIGDFMFQ